MPIEITLVGFEQLRSFAEKMPFTYKREITTLFRSLGAALVENVKDRIISRNGGQWQDASKWSKAKTGYNFPTLLGAEKYVKFSVSPERLQIYGQTGKPWTLTQHHEGFTNALEGPDEEHDEHGRVVIPIKDPRPLGLYTEFKKKRDGSVVPRATVFAFVPKRAGQTPPRKIWPDKAEAETIVQPIASRWLEKIVNESGYVK